MLQQVKRLTEAQLQSLVQMNLDSVPAVNAIAAEDFSRFAETAELFGVIELERELAGFIIALGSGHEYDSLNYQYFDQRYDNFLYVDRIVIDEQYRRQGYGKRIYQTLEQVAASQNCNQLCCEVNLKPANPGSMQFHTDFGFQQVATQETEGGVKEVSLLVKSLA